VPRSRIRGSVHQHRYSSSIILLFLSHSLYLLFFSLLSAIFFGPNILLGNHHQYLLSRWFLSQLIFSTLKLEAICFSESSVDTQQTRRCYIPEDGIIQTVHYLSEFKEAGVHTLMIKTVCLHYFKIWNTFPLWDWYEWYTCTERTVGLLVYRDSNLSGHRHEDLQSEKWS
jgi:hypothetical protein